MCLFGAAMNVPFQVSYEYAFSAQLLVCLSFGRRPNAQRELVQAGLRYGSWMKGAPPRQITFVTPSFRPLAQV